MAGQAVPGTVVPSGSLTSPGGYQGPAGATGSAGLNAFNITSGSFTVPNVGSTVTVTLNDASWAVVGQFVYVDQAAGGPGNAGILQITAKTGNQITLLNPTTTPTIPPADATQSGLLRQVSGNTTDFVDGSNHCQNLNSAILTGPVRTYGANGLAPGFNQRLQIHDNMSYPISTTAIATSQLLTVSPIPWYVVAATSGGGGVSSYYSGTGYDIYNKVYGAFAIETGAASGNYVVLTTYGTLITTGLGALDLYFRFSIGRLPTATDNFVIEVGFSDGATSAANSSALVMVYDSGVGAPCWYGQNAKASVTTLTAKQTTPAIVVISSTAFTMYNVHISINAAWTAATFYVNGVQIGSPIGGLPAAGIMVSPWIFTQKTAGSSLQGAVYIDDVAIDYQYSMP